MWLTTFGIVCKLKQKKKAPCDFAYAFFVDALKVDRFIAKCMMKRQKPFGGASYMKWSLTLPLVLSYLYFMSFHVFIISLQALFFFYVWEKCVSLFITFMHIFSVQIWAKIFWNIQNYSPIQNSLSIYSNVVQECGSGSVSVQFFSWIIWI